MVSNSTSFCFISEWPNFDTMIIHWSKKKVADWSHLTNTWSKPMGEKIRWKGIEDRSTFQWFNYLACIQFKELSWDWVSMLEGKWRIKQLPVFTITKGKGLIGLKYPEYTKKLCPITCMCDKHTADLVIICHLSCNEEVYVVSTTS
jgi:hypothetical protein